MTNPVRFLSFLVACTVAFTGCADIGADNIGNTNAALSSAKDIQSYKIGTSLGTRVGTIGGTLIAVAVPPGVSLTSLVAEFSPTTGASVAVGGVPQISGTTPNDFTNPVIYTVTAADGTIKNYTVMVATLVTGFSFTNIRGTAVTFPSDGVNPKLTTPPVMSQVGVQPASNGGFFGASSWTGAASADPDLYFSFTVSPVAGETMTLNTLALDSLRAGTGPLAFSLRSSLDNFAADLQVFSIEFNASGSYVFVLGASFANLTMPVEFRLYGFASASLGYWRIDNVQLAGSIVP